VDPTLRRNGDGSLSPVASTVTMTFSNGGSGAFARMSRDGQEFSLSWPAKLPTPLVEGNQATYREVLRGVDLQVQADVDGFRHLLVIKDKAAAKDPAVQRIHLATRTKGLSLRTDAAGAVSAVDDHGRAVFAGGVPVMWDSSVAEEQPAASIAAGAIVNHGVSAESAASEQKARPNGSTSRSDASSAGSRRAVVRAVTGGGELVLVPDQAMLAAADTKYPVKVDPNWQYSTGGVNSWATVSTNAPNPLWNAPLASDSNSYSGDLKVGRSPTGFTTRELFNMDTSQVQRKHISKATFSLDQLWSSSYCGDRTTRRTTLWLTEAPTSSLTWNTAWNANGSGWHGQTGSDDSLKFYNNGSCPAGRVEFDATSAVITASSNGWGSVPLGLRASNESDTSSWKRYKSSSVLLTVEYNSYPNAAEQLSTSGRGCTTGAGRPVLNSITPTLTARVSDPDQQELVGLFYWWPSGSGGCDEPRHCDRDHPVWAPRRRRDIRVAGAHIRRVRYRAVVGGL
jgi:hypothetical protein